GGSNWTHVSTPAFVDTLLQKFKSAGHNWVGVIQNAAKSLFWILAGISLVFIGLKMIGSMNLMEVLIELIRFILFTGFFFWLLLNGPNFAQLIIASLWQLGGQAGGFGNQIYPGDMVSLGM